MRPLSPPIDINPIKLSCAYHKYFNDTEIFVFQNNPVSAPHPLSIPVPAAAAGRGGGRGQEEEDPAP